MAWYKTGGGGTDTSDATLNNSNQMLSGVTAYANDIKYTGSMPDTDVVENAGSVSGTTYTQGKVTVDTAGYIASGDKISGATFANTATSGTTYKDISGTTAAPVLISDDYLYINKGYTDDIKISLAKLAPDEASADLASDKILSGYSAYNNDGQLVAGNIPSKSKSDITIANNTATIPVGNYATSATVAASELVGGNIELQISSSTDVTNYATATVKAGSISTTEGEISGTSYTQGKVSVNTAGYISAGDKVQGSTFVNTATSGTTYKDISNTTAAPVLISGDYLYINKGYTDDVKISLAKLVPEGASADLSSDKILSGYSAYNNDGQLIAGNIPTKTSSNITIEYLSTVNGVTVTIPPGFYSSQVVLNITNIPVVAADPESPTVGDTWIKTGA